MPRTPNEYVVHLMIEGGHREEVRFATIKSFRNWYSSNWYLKAAPDEFISVPIKTFRGEFCGCTSICGLWRFEVEPILVLVWNFRNDQKKDNCFNDLMGSHNLDFHAICHLYATTQSNTKKYYLLPVNKLGRMSKFGVKWSTWRRRAMVASIDNGHRCFKIACCCQLIPALFRKWDYAIAPVRSLLTLRELM